MPDATTCFGFSYFGNRYPHHAREDLRAMADLGATFVVHVMSEADLRWNPGTLGDLVGIGVECGLEPWFTPWCLGGLFGGETASYAVGEHPEACQRDNAGRHLPALCPRQPIFRALMAEWLDAAAAAGAAIVQADELHLALPHHQGAERWACRCGACQEAFRTRYGEEMPHTATAETAAFLDDLLAETLAWIVAAAAERGMGTSMVLLPEAYDAARWRALAAMPGVRYFGSTPFWLFQGIPAAQTDSYARLWAERTVLATAGTAAQPLGWVQAFSVPAGREHEIERVTAIMAESGVSTIAYWSYLACIAMSGLAGDDPHAAWQAVVRSMQPFAARQ
jgi:hypothetical protein